MKGGEDLLVTDWLFRRPGWEEARGSQWRLDCCLLLPERSWYCYWPGFLALLNRWRLMRGQTRNSGKASLGPLQQQRGVKTSNTLPCSFPAEGWAGSSYGVKVGVCPGVEPGGWLRWLAHPWGGVECRGHSQYPVFAPGSSEVAVAYLVSLYLVQNLPQLHMRTAQLHMRTVIFSPLKFLCILLMEVMFFQVQALQQKVWSLGLCQWGSDGGLIQTS